jgi:type III restriction enzyme
MTCLGSSDKQRLLSDRKGRSRSVIIFNDEAHHAYRRGGLAEDEEEPVLDEETAKCNDCEATVWINGLDRISAYRMCLSALSKSAAPQV